MQGETVGGDGGSDCGRRAVNRASCIDTSGVCPSFIVVVECASLAGDREDEEKDKEQKKIGKQTERRARGRRRCGEAPGTRQAPVVGHLTWAAVPAHCCVLVRGPCSVNRKIEE